LRDVFLYEVKIDGGGFYGSVSQELLDGIYIRSMGQQMSGKGMS
jgi:hypothetical protein